LVHRRHPLVDESRDFRGVLLKGRHRRRVVCTTITPVAVVSTVV
jgi:hypothetical protein